MVEGHRLTGAREAVEQLLQSEHANVLRERVAWAVRELRGAEVAAQIGAELGHSVSKQRRAAQRLTAIAGRLLSDRLDVEPPDGSGATVAGTLVTRVLSDPLLRMKVKLVGALGLLVRGCGVGAGD